MGLTLADLTTPKTRDEMAQILLERLAGRGGITHVGTGDGVFTITGSPTDAHAVVIEVTGDVGVEVNVNVFVDGMLNDGIGWAKDAAVSDPVLPGLEITPTGTFVAGDTYAFALTSPNLPSSSWQPGSVPRAIIEAEADALADLSSLVAAIAAGGLLETASGDWLTLLAAQMYGITRNPATPTKGFITLTNPSGAGAKAIAVGQLWFLANNASGSKYTNIEAGVLPAGPSSLTLRIQAEQPGTAANSPIAVSTMLTPLPGVTCALPFDWLSAGGAVQGTDEESDVLLKQRCRDQWAALGTGATVAQYRLWARNAHQSVVRVLAYPDPAVSGRVALVIAGPNGTVLASDVVTAVDDYIRPRMPLATDLQVSAAAAHGVAVAGTVYVEAVKASAAQAAAIAALNAYFNQCPIGGYSTPLNGHVVSLEKIIGLITGQDGVIDFAPTSPPSDVTLGATEIPAPDLSGLTFTPV